MICYLFMTKHLKLIVDAKATRMPQEPTLTCMEQHPIGSHWMLVPLSPIFTVNLTTEPPVHTCNCMMPSSLRDHRARSSPMSAVAMRMGALAMAVCYASLRSTCTGCQDAIWV